MTQYEKMTQTPIPKLIVSLSIPTIISMLVTNIYNLVDTAFVGKLGTSASGAVGVVFGFMSILQAIGFLFGQGSGSIIARRLGTKDNEAASEVASTGFFTAFGIATLVGIGCMIGLDDLVTWLGSTPTIAPYAKSYIMFILIAAPFMVTSFTLNNILRYEGKAILGMVGLMVGAVLNILGDAILMFGCHLGIMGAGISTAVSQIISFGILISMFLRDRTSCRISLRNFRFREGVIWEIVSTGFPSLLRQGLNSITTVLLNSEAAVYGDPAVAAMSIVSRIIFFMASVAIGVGQGFQPVSGFNYGAGRYDRVKKGYWFTMILSEVILTGLGIVVFVFSPNLIRIFRDHESVVRIGTRALRLQAISQVVMPLCMSTEMMFQSTGSRIPATLLSAMRNGIIFIPTLLILANLRGLAGIQEAQPLANLLGVIPTVICAVWFFRSKLKGKENKHESI
ncbi:MAG: MATE family efflux transporter [Agathobacter sp.]|uniref:MATE family efflux transporter n=1 Tax=Agathobacter sp. TaxID=2021311 RepID=UPI00258B74BF|nr:MATE family efflux transporter [Agathobacter sp.]MCR5676556.1 MATE family efflux transporter [Agathobacter sp.]